ncbi:MAG: cytochrome c biogenesis protein CcdA, partial [bacterium]
MTTGFFWLAATTGLLSLLTPCVFPMVPVTIAYFSTPVGRRSASCRRPLLFGLGIIATFTLLGLVLASLFGAAGLNRFAADPTVNLVLAALFVIFAANLFGWIATPVPWRVANAADRAARGTTPGSSLGALVMGATFTLTSVTCTAPFVGTLLVLAAKGSWAMPVLGMLVYSTFFALPFVLLALVPGTLSKLPRAGDWMQTIRVLIGLLEVGAAIKFLSNADLVRGWGVVTRNVVLLAWAALAVLGAVYLGRLALAKQQRREANGAALIPIAATLLLAVWLLSGLNGRVLPQIEAFLPPAINHTPRLGNSLSPTWMLNDLPRAEAVAKSSGKAVFIDFTGYT